MLSYPTELEKGLKLGNANKALKAPGLTRPPLARALALQMDRGKYHSLFKVWQCCKCRRWGHVRRLAITLTQQFTPEEHC